VVVPDYVAREVPVILRICEQRPTLSKIVLNAEWTSTPTRVSGHDPRTYEYVIRTVKISVSIESCFDRPAQ
jgi:hypothetical protein